VAKRDTTSRLQRLDELKALLRAQEHITATELAAALRVSLRTLNRDLALLREGGIPIESDRGRGGGLRLHRHWSIGRVNLDYREAIDVLLSIAITEKLGSALLLKTARSVRNKLAATFSPAHREKIKLARTRILIGDSASSTVISTYRASNAASTFALQEGFFEMKTLEIVYVDEKMRRTSRSIEPQFLYLSWPAWYLLCWDELRQGIRCFRVDRIERATVTTTSFRLRGKQPFLEAVGGLGEEL
jgi:predicted DNA-binding transcriptional regulator YafY